MSGIDNSERPNGLPQATVGTPRAREVPARRERAREPPFQDGGPRGTSRLRSPGAASDPAGREKS